MIIALVRGGAGIADPAQALSWYRRASLKNGIFVAYLNYLWFIEAVRGDHLGMEMPVTAPRSLSVIAS